MAAACVVVTWSPALHTTSIYLTGLLRTCEHVTLSVNQEHNSRQTKTDQVQTDPRNREPAAGGAVAGKGRESRARQGLKNSSRHLSQRPEGAKD